MTKLTPAASWDVSCPECKARKGSSCVVVGDLENGLRTTRVTHDGRWVKHFKAKDDAHKSGKSR